jgi:hypothetical protein
MREVVVTMIGGNRIAFGPQNQDLGAYHTSRSDRGEDKDGRPFVVVYGPDYLNSIRFSTRFRLRKIIGWWNVTRPIINRNPSSNDAQSLFNFLDLHLRVTSGLTPKGIDRLSPSYKLALDFLARLCF